MPINVPTPFTDVDLPPRTDGQKQEDRRRNQEQTALLSPPAGSQTVEQAGESAGEEDPDELLEKLVRRREGAGEAVVQFDSAPTVTRRWSLVVPQQWLVRHSDNGEPPPEINETLNNNNFTAERALTDSLVCPELAGRLTVYTHKGEHSKRFDDTLNAVNALQVPGGQAAPTLVTALHQTPPPRPKTIVKAAVGPAPTTVDEDDRGFGEAGRRRPEGETIVAVIDTGIAEVRRADRWLYEVPRDPGCVDPLDSFPPPGNTFLDFAAGHGTFAAGIVRLVDRDTQIKVYATLDGEGFATETDIACAMIQAVREGAHVLNLSLGMHTVDNKGSVAFELALEAIDRIAQEQEREPPVIVASAGNYGDDVPVWPAAFAATWDRVISVAGLTADLEPADWSSRGDWVTCSCVGEGIVSTFVPGDEDPEFSEDHPGFPNPDHFPVDAWAVWTGTSFAAPQIAGAIARRMRQDGGLISPQSAADLLLQDGVSINHFGKALLLLRGT
ncbi:MAG: S8/S53 family peptidase [Nocardioides sp.]